MIARIWHGYTKIADADTYEHMLTREIFSGIQERRINGFQKIELLVRTLAEETEFVTIMWFDSMDAVKEFAGPDFEKAVIFPDAIPLLTRYDQRSQHYEVIK